MCTCNTFAKLVQRIFYTINPVWRDIESSSWGYWHNGILVHGAPWLVSRGVFNTACAGGDLTNKYSKSTETRDFQLRSDQRFLPQFNLRGATSGKNGQQVSSWTSTTSYFLLINLQNVLVAAYCINNELSDHWFEFSFRLVHYVADVFCFLRADSNTLLEATRRYLRHVKTWLSLFQQQSQVCFAPEQQFQLISGSDRFDAAGMFFRQDSCISKGKPPAFGSWAFWGRGWALLPPFWRPGPHA